MVIEFAGMGGGWRIIFLQGGVWTPAHGSGGQVAKLNFNLKIQE